VNPGDIFNTLLLQPTINLVVLLIRSIEFLHLPGTLGIAIIALTIIIKLLTWPFTAQQMRSTKKMMDLKPHLDKLKEKHKDDKTALASAQMALYKEHGVNPAGGCIPAVFQILLIYPLYQVIQAVLDPVKGLAKINYFLYDKSWHLDKLPDAHFLGFNLANKPSEFAKLGLILLLIPVVTGLLQLVLSKMMAPQGVKPYPSDSPKEVKEKVKEEDMATAMQSQMLVMMPIMIGFFAYQFPIGLALYWNTLSIMSIIQQYNITGLGGLQNWIDRFSAKRK
jgi:YidC/Oxa1 family membrane protein insertase